MSEWRKWTLPGSWSLLAGGIRLVVYEHSEPGWYGWDITAKASESMIEQGSERSIDAAKSAAVEAATNLVEDVTGAVGGVIIAERIADWLVEHFDDPEFLRHDTANEPGGFVMAPAPGKAEIAAAIREGRWRK